MSAFLSPPPKLRFFGTDGRPLAGGTLMTYHAGNDDRLLSTWADSEMVTRNPAVLPLDANGEPSCEGIPRNIFLEVGRKYKLRWFDSNGTEVGSCDNVGVSGGDSGGGGGGVSEVAHDDTLVGDGTRADPLGAVLGTTEVRGVVQLTDSHTSTDTSTAATPKNVKEAYDLAASKQDQLTEMTDQEVQDLIDSLN